MSDITLKLTDKQRQKIVDEVCQVPISELIERGKNKPVSKARARELNQIFAKAFDAARKDK